MNIIHVSGGMGRTKLFQVSKRFSLKVLYDQFCFHLYEVRANY